MNPSVPPLDVIARDPAALDESAIKEIAQRDNMNESTVDRYFAVGRSAIAAIAKVLIIHGSGAPTDVLDFACGFGRVARYLRAAFPAARLSVADDWREAVDFSARTFEAAPIYSAANFSTIPLGGPFDLIWCGSLMTHVSEHDVLAIMDLFERHLRPGAAMIFTTHGREMYRRRISGKHSFGITDAQFEELAATYQSGRHGFVEYPHRRHYGISLTPPQWIVAAVAAHERLSLISFTEAGWDNHQDVVAVAKR
jgi:SAM-dependent methyltransferase